MEDILTRLTSVTCFFRKDRETIEAAIEEIERLRDDLSKTILLLIFASQTVDEIAKQVPEKDREELESLH